MKNHWLTAFNIITLIVFTEIMCAFQSSLWMQVLGSFPPPLFWIVIMTYVILHRQIGEGVFMTYLITFVLCAFTAQPFEHLLLNNMLILIFLLLIKNRIYWSSANYFMLMTGAAVGLHHISLLVLSQFLDSNPLRSPEFFHWMLSFLLTLLVSFPIYRFLRWFDRMTQRDESVDPAGGLI